MFEAERLDDEGERRSARIGQCDTMAWKQGGKPRLGVIWTRNEPSDIGSKRNCRMKRDHRILLPVLHYLPVLGGFEVFLKNIVERVGQHTDMFVVTGKVAGQPAVENRGRASIIRKASLYPLRDLSYSSYWYIISMMPILLGYTIYLTLTKHITLLHANGFFSGLVCLATRALTGVPYVLTIQSADFTIYHEEVGLNFIVRLQDFFERMVYRHAVVCHAVSNDLCAHYMRQGAKACVMIPNGVETNLFKPITVDERQKLRTEHNIPQDAFVISNISRIEPKNGVSELIDAVAVVVKENPNVLLMLIGSGSKREELEAYVREKGLEKHVRFMGQVKYENVGPLVAMSDAFARTPRAEGFGIVFLEAMAAGVPVIGTRTGGIPDFIEHDVTGLLCEVRDVESIAQALRRLATDPTLRERLVANATTMIRERYDWDVIAERVDTEVYQAVL